MKRLFPIVLLGLGLMLSACSAPGPVSRNAPLEIPPRATSVAPTTQDWHFAGVEVIVPRSLSVSEANSIKPRADIVWRGDPVGDRYAQVTRVLQEPLERVLPAMQGDTPVIISLHVTRFHSQTQRVRYTFGGDHEIEFDLSVRHAETGQILSGPRHVDLTFDAYGGRQALAAEARGNTARVRIHARMIEWVREEFDLPIPATGLIY